MISIIAALDLKNAIGADNKLPWHLPDDLKRFKKLTLGKPVIMGRKTFESIGKPLPGRQNIVLTRDPFSFVLKYGDLPHFEDIKVYSDLNKLYLKLDPNEENFIIGGAEIYNMFLPLTDTLYLTQVHTKIGKGDAYFPKVDLKSWSLLEREEHNIDQKHPYAFEYLTYKK